MGYEKNCGLLFSYGDDRCDSARSTLNSPPTSVGDPDTDHIYNRAARTRNDLSLRCCEAFMDKACDHVAVEPMHERKLVFRHAV
jgi:hypothetical protein